MEKMQENTEEKEPDLKNFGWVKEITSVDYV